jgi:hypothetical protein
MLANTHDIASSEKMVQQGHHKDSRLKIVMTMFPLFPIWPQLKHK